MCKARLRVRHRGVACVAFLAGAAAMALPGCGGRESAPPAGEHPGVPARPSGARVGVDPVPVVYRAEDNSDALARWVAEDVRDRIVVHVDGHIDLDWLPDETVERILAARDEDELRALAAHPYDLDAPPHGRFAIWSYIYPAHRGGRVRELWWVVPDGSLTGPRGFELLRHRILARRLSGVSPEEVLGFRLENGVASGTLYGLPVRIAELDALPSFGESVVLDLDADYFGTALASDQSLLSVPVRSVADVMAAFAERGLSADLATVCASNVGGYLPLRSRGAADELVLWLRDPAEAKARADEIGSRLRMARHALDRGEYADAATLLGALRAVRPEEPALTFLLAEALDGAGDANGAAAARAEASSSDPAYAHSILFDADNAYLDGRTQEALDGYRRALDEGGPYEGYIRRRIAMALLGLNRLEEGVRALRDVLARHPTHADSHANLGLSLADLGRVDEAAESLQEAVRLDPWNGSHARSLALALGRLGRWPEALPPALDALRLRPSDPEAGKTAALVLARNGRLAEGRRAVSPAVRLAPTDADAFALLGSLAFMDGDRPEAVAGFRRALEIAPGHPMARAGLARVSGAPARP